MSGVRSCDILVSKHYPHPTRVTCAVFNSTRRQKTRIKVCILQNDEECFEGTKHLLVYEDNKLAMQTVFLNLFITIDYFYQHYFYPLLRTDCVSDSIHHNRLFYQHYFYPLIRSPRDQKSFELEFSILLIFFSLFNSCSCRCNYKNNVPTQFVWNVCL